MKKIFVFALVLLLIFSLCACNNEQLPNDDDNQQQVQGKQLLAEGNVIKIDVFSRPGAYNYSFTGENAKAIIDYLSNLNLDSNFEENPGEYNGMVWVISLEYDNGDELTLYHSGQFIRPENGSWYKMTYEEGRRFDALLHELSD